MGAYIDSIKSTDGIKHPVQDNTIFTGTREQWDQLTTAQKQSYRIANFTDDLGSDAGITDAVTDGDMRAVTSNAVHDALGNAGVKTFVGTTDEWNLLSTEQKTSYEIVDITDDYDPAPDTPEIWGFIDHMNILDPSLRIEYIKTNKNYTPLSISLSTHTADYGSWEGNPILEANVPAMIKANGTVDYYLDPDDYTKKLDGTASDVANTAYEGGAFAYIPKVYKREYINGNDRYVMFSMTKVNNDYKPVGFIDHLGNEYDGMWIPMFYSLDIVQNNVHKLLSIGNSDQYIGGGGGAELQKTYIENGMPTARFFGGPIINVINDLLILFAKNSNLDYVYGYGTSLTSIPRKNAIVNGGRFYGTQDGGSYNKVFHSLIPITCMLDIRDPYTMMFYGRLKVSPYYYFDLTGESEYIVDTGYDYDSTVWNCPTRGVVIPNYGFMFYPEVPSGGSTSLAYGDTLRVDPSKQSSVCLRFGNVTVQRANGPMAALFHESPGQQYDNLYTASPMVFGALSQQSVGGA